MIRENEMPEEALGWIQRWKGDPIPPTTIALYSDSHLLEWLLYVSQHLDNRLSTVVSLI